MSINTNSPEYLAGVRAGRRSLRISIGYKTPADKYELPVMNMDITALSLGNNSLIECGPFKMLIVDEMPDFEDYPDLENDD